MRLFKSSWFCQVMLLSCLLALPQLALAAVNAFDKPVLHPAIPLVDEAGQHVLDSGKPYSTRMSCGNGEGGGCHDIDKISNSYHFDMGRSEAEDNYGKKRGVVPVVSPGYFGGFNCMLANNPLWLSKKSNASVGEFLDYGAAGLVKTCGGCHNGGGFAEKDRNGIRYDEPKQVQPLDGDYFEWQGGDEPTEWDWNKSGVVEPDCLLCHVDFSQLKGISPATNRADLACQGMDCSLTGVDQWSNLRANQLLKNGHFREANSAILSFLDIDPGAGEKILLSSISNPAGNAAPTLQWNRDAFDGNKKMVMPMLRFPANDNCMLCHNTSNKRRGFYGFGPESLVEKDANGKLIDDYHDDVHKGKTWTENGETRDIENCNACHSKQYYKPAYQNIDLDADHNFLIGNSDQDVRRDLNYQPGPLSCEYCHGGAEFGSPAKPALPNSQKTTLLAAHRKLWEDNGDMDYKDASKDKAVYVHFQELACQTCHTPDVKDHGSDLTIRYRKWEAGVGYEEDPESIIRSGPYQTLPRFYWWDKNNQRIVSRRERLQVPASVTVPQSYAQVKQVKADMDALLTQQGMKNVDTQLVWTESNEYLLAHNTKAAKATMPCDDCHKREGITPSKPRGTVTSRLQDELIFGVKKIRVIAGMTETDGYQKLVDEGVVKLDMPYYSINGKGQIVDDAKSINDETESDPFLSALRTPSQNVMSGEFRVVTADEVAKALLDDTAAIEAAATLYNQKAFLYGSRIAGTKVEDVAVMLGYDKTSSELVPNYRLEVAARFWTSMSQRVSAKKVKPIKKIEIKQGKLVGSASSAVFDLTLQDQQKQRASALAGHRMLIKLPYTGLAKATGEVALLALKTDADGILVKKNPLSPVAAQIVAVKSQKYVVALLDTLPEHVMLYDLKLKKKKT